MGMEICVGIKFLWEQGGAPAHGGGRNVEGGLSSSSFCRADCEVIHPLQNEELFGQGRRGLRHRRYDNLGGTRSAINYSEVLRSFEQRFLPLRNE